MRVLLAFWIVGLGIGVHTMLQYQLTPGLPGSPSSQWLENSLVTLDAERPTLLVFAHPRCPCTTATISELERLMACIKDRAATHVVFYKPANMVDGWEHTDLWYRTMSVPHVEAVFDTNGRLSKRFGVETSGTAILYDTDGKQLFHGGITSSRGHEGGNVGATAIEAFVLKTHANCASAPVFGCSLHNLKTNETDE